MAKSILVTGATGFVGSRLVSRLVAKGHRVSVLSRSPERASAHLPQVASRFAWTPTEGPPPPASLEGVEAIVHLAGEPVVGRWSAAKRKAIELSRTLGTRHLVEGIRAMPVPPSVLVGASAIGFYGDQGEEVLAEDAASGADFLAGVCRDWEDAACGAESLGVRVARLRIGLVLDPEGGALNAMLTPFKFGLGGPLGSGAQWWSWIHLEDLLALIQLAVEDDSLRGAYNATAPEPARQVEFARTLGRVLGRPTFFPGPKTALRLALGGFAAELLSSRRVIPSAATKAGFQFSHPELEPALRDLLAPTG
ncbi:MAG: TIGR01777 family oxidoreductase [Planctomycetota bacterium]|jgi:uncharacterized protein (TIGR01777 family)